MAHWAYRLLSKPDNPSLIDFQILRWKERTDKGKSSFDPPPYLRCDMHVPAFTSPPMVIINKKMFKLLLITDWVLQCLVKYLPIQVYSLCFPAKDS